MINLLFVEERIAAQSQQCNAECSADALVSEPENQNYGK